MDWSNTVASIYRFVFPRNSERHDICAIREHNMRPFFYSEVNIREDLWARENKRKAASQNFVKSCRHQFYSEK